MFRIALVALAVLSPLTLHAATIFTGTGSGAVAEARAFEGPVFLASYLPYAAFTGGVRVGAGDVNGDGVPDIITGAGAGAPGGHVKVIDGQTGADIRSFFSFAGFDGGVFVAGGKINNDNFADIVVGAGDTSSGGHVKVFDGATNAEIRSFFAYPSFQGGVRVGAADVNRDGFADIITGAGPGSAGGHVKVFDGATGAELRSFLSFDGFQGGVFVAGGDVNGDGFSEIIAGTDEGGAAAHVKVFDGQTNNLLHSFFAYTGFSGGVRVGAGDVNGDGLADIITGAGVGSPGGHVRVFNGQTGAELHSFLAYDSDFRGGIYVAGAVVPEPQGLLLLLLGGLAAVVGVGRLRVQGSGFSRR
jgi:hypothetical protein